MDSGDKIRLVAAGGIILLELVALYNHVDGAALAAAIGALGAIGGFQHAKLQAQAQAAAAAKIPPKS